MNFTSEPTTTQSTTTTIATLGHNFHIMGFTAASVIIFSILGTLGNVLATLSLLLSQKLRRSPSTAFMVNLSACFLPVYVLGWPIFGIGCIQLQYYGEILYPKWLSVVAFIMIYTLGQVHINTICALAFNRMVAIMWPQVYKRMMQPRWVKVYLLFIWVYSILIWLPFASGMLGVLEFNETTLHLRAKTITKTMKSVLQLFTIILPVLFTGICYIIIYLQIRRSKQSQVAKSVCEGATEDSTLKQWEEQVVRTIFIIFVILLSCNIQHILFHIIPKKKNVLTARIIIHLVFWMQFCLDPVVYIVSSQQYREAVREFLKRFIYPCFSSTGDAHTSSQTNPTIEPSEQL